MYKSIFNNSEIFHLYYRRKLFLLIESKKNIDSVNYPYIYGNNNKWAIFEENYNKIIYSGEDVGEMK